MSQAATAAQDASTDFRLTDATEIRALLQQLRDDCVPIVLAAPDGTSYTTVLWSCDPKADQLCFSADEHHTQPERLTHADDTVAMAYLDSVKIQFDASQLLLVHAEHGCSLQAPWPHEIYRFQRRGSFRVRTLERTSPSAHLRHPSVPDMRLTLRIVDVSIGGCALLQPANVPALQPGTRIHQVHVDLDADTRFTAGVLLHHVSSLHDSSAHRLGCEWLKLDGQAQRALQRYIDATQKRRRMLNLDR